MAIEKMSLISVEGGADMLDKALIACCESKCFQIRELPGGSGTMLSNLNEQNPYVEVYSGLREMAEKLGIEPRFCDFGKVRQESGEELKALLDGLSGELERVKSEYDDLAASIEELKQTDSYIQHLLGLDVSFTDLYELKYVKMRIGRLPADNLEKLDYYSGKCIEFIPFEKNPDYIWGIYLAPTVSVEFADAVMNSLYFERMHLPDYLDSDAKSVDDTLQKAIADEEKLKDELGKQISDFAKLHKDELLSAMSKAKYKSDCFELRKKALIAAGKFSLSGYCPTRQAKALCKTLSDIDGVQTVEIPISTKDASPDVPIKLRNNAVFRPFEMFVKMYGLPSYGGFDPTPYVAVTYSLIFGIMFGDLGQGLVVSLLGLLITKFTKNGLGPIMIRIGLFSAAFGVLYGSVFGIETIITPFFHHEAVWRFLGYTHQPENIFQVATMLLIAALMLGAVLILISMTFNMVLNFRKKKVGEALFSVNGVSGIVFYASLLIGVAGMFMFGVPLFSPAYVICLIVLPLVLIFFKTPLSALVSGTKPEKISVGSFIIENFIDLFEAALTFLSNTMSFLRIGGYIMSHAGLMLVVAQLAGTNVPGAPITVGTVIIYIIGNILVMGIEGVLVGIQVLRLEFYEIFNRFYDGSGQSFRPIDVTLEPEN